MGTDKATGSLAEFIADLGLTMTVERADNNPHMDPDGSRMDNWKCRIRQGRKSLTTPFSQGIGHKGAEPTLPGVLECLASDAASIENARDFADFADEMGMDSDSIKALRMYKVCQREAAKLSRFLGAEAYDRLLFHTDRL